jgi:ABC-type multidrug transport system fused ATPase/permease subunit
VSESQKQVTKVTFSVVNDFVVTSGGYALMALFIISMIVKRATELYSNKYLGEWTEAYDQDQKFQHFKTYALIMVISATSELMTNSLRQLLAYTLSNTMHGKMIFALLHSKIQRFIDKVPYGLIQNRFMGDLSSVDEICIQAFSDFVTNLVHMIVITLTIGQIAGHHIIILILIWYFYISYHQRRYVEAKKEYSKLKTVSESSFTMNLLDTYNGLTYSSPPTRSFSGSTSSPS